VQTEWDPVAWFPHWFSFTARGFAAEELLVGGLWVEFVGGCETDVAGGGETDVAGGGETDVAGWGETDVAGWGETDMAGWGETDVAGGGEMDVAGGYMLGASAAKIGDRATSKSMKNPPCLIGVLEVTPGTWLLDMSCGCVMERLASDP